MRRSRIGVLPIALVVFIGACTADNPSFTGGPDGGFNPFGDLAGRRFSDLGDGVIGDLAVPDLVAVPDLAKPPPPDLADTGHGPGADVAEDPAEWDVADANGDAVEACKPVNRGGV